MIAEDDPTSRKVLSHFIKSLPNYTIVGIAENGEQLIELIISEKPDVALVDIKMPRLNGMDAVKSCKEWLPSLQVIFITGHDEFAIEAFEIAAVDYILKPIERTRLYSALNKVLTPSTVKMPNEQKKELIVKEYNTINFIPFEEIIFIEKVERKTTIYTIRGIFQTNEPLSELMKNLDVRFMLTHRSYIINLEEISKIIVDGQMYIAHFTKCNETAKISKHKINEVYEIKTSHKIILGKVYED